MVRPPTTYLLPARNDIPPPVSVLHWEAFNSAFPREATLPSKPSFVSIPARTMALTNIHHVVKQSDETRAVVKVGWSLRCMTCQWKQTYMFHQHHLAVAATRSHSCYRDK